LVLLRGEVVLLVGSVCFSDRFGVTELYIFSTVLFLFIAKLTECSQNFFFRCTFLFSFFVVSLS